MTKPHSFSQSQIFKLAIFMLFAYSAFSSCASGEFEYWNTTCLTGCVFPLVQSTNGAGEPSCVYPCASNEFLHYNGSCEASCPSPLIPTVEIDKQFCDIPCSGTNKYLFPDNTCGSSCTAPMQIAQARGAYFCNFTCDPTWTLYLNPFTAAWPRNRIGYIFIK